MRFFQWLAHVLYRVVFDLVLPISGVVVLPFVLLARKRRKTILRRLGWQDFPRTPAHEEGPIWVHSLSVGETLSARQLILELRARLDGRPLYLSVSTLSGMEIAQEQLGQHVDGIFYFPYDITLIVRRCLRQIQPVLFVQIETDIWPGFLAELRRSKIPALLLNGRLSPESFFFYKHLKLLFQPAFNTFEGVYPQSRSEADRFIELGVKPDKVRHCGNLKFDTTRPPREAEKQIAAFRESLRLDGSVPVLLAGSTHAGEESILKSVFIELRKTFPELVLVLVPRHPDRAEEIRGLFAADPLDVDLFSLPPRQAPVLVVDRMGYLGLLYALADVAFVGGSLVHKGGQSPIEPSLHGKPVLFGPDMHDFPDISRWLMEAGGAFQVNDRTELLARCRELFGDLERARAVGLRARQVVEEHRGTTQKIVDDILRFVERRGREAPRASGTGSPGEKREEDRGRRRADSLADR